MILYVAGPMTGLPDLNYPAFIAASDRLVDAGYQTLNPVDVEIHNATGRKQRWDWYMRHAIRMVLEAEGLAVLPGWQNSKGARLEVEIAIALELPIKTLEEWLEACRRVAPRS